MKNFRLLTVILVLLSALVLGSQAQTSVQKPDQVKLMRQLEGTWQAESGKDTLAVTVLKTFGTGLDGYTRVETKGKTISERRLLFGYDKQTDQFIEAEVTLGSEMELWACWFTKQNFMVGVPYANRFDPEKSVLRVEIDIKSPDSYSQTVFQNGKRIGGRIMNRKKG
jgi:hypothetical protein